MVNNPIKRGRVRTGACKHCGGDLMSDLNEKDEPIWKCIQCGRGEGDK